MAVPWWHILVAVTARRALPSAEGAVPTAVGARLGFHNLCPARTGSGELHSTHMEGALFNYPCLIADHSQQDFFLSKCRKTLKIQRGEVETSEVCAAPRSQGDILGCPFAIAPQYLPVPQTDAQRGKYLWLLVEKAEVLLLMTLN